jgi:hypothetical protein
MIPMPSCPQTEITAEHANLNTILALADEWLEQAIRESRPVTDFGLSYATQFPGGGQLW